MFGYFRFNQLYATPRVKNVYKNYYCGTCFALEYNYGEVARFILSYDVVLLALVAKLYDTPNKETLPCFCRKKEKEQFINDERWQKLAAINVLLMNAKLDDDINDEQSKKARIVAILFSKAINKAKKSFPELAQIISDGYLKMYSLEQGKNNILDICNAFADMMVQLMRVAFNVDQDKVVFIKGISRWLYFIDQLDDYDDDIKEGKYNPLVVEGVSKSELINVRHDVIYELLSEIFNDFEQIKTVLDMTYSEDVLLDAVINESIPSVTARVLSGKDMPKLLHRKSTLEWENE